MHVNIQAIPPGAKFCKILGTVHTKISDSDNFWLVDNELFIRNMPETARVLLFGTTDPTDEAIQKVAKDWKDKRPGINKRVIFDGTTVEMGVIVAKNCLIKCDLNLSDIDYVIVGTNTGTYPTAADTIYNELIEFSGEMNTHAGCSDIGEACTVGSAAVFVGSALVRSGQCKTVLVILTEKATSLSDPNDWKGANLFGDAAAAMIIQVSLNPEDEAFIAFSLESFPQNGQLRLIYKTENAFFFQDGQKVHKFVGTEVVKMLKESLVVNNIDINNVKHIIPHQPSGSTLALFESEFLKAFPNQNGKIRFDVDTGNTSGASTPSLISKLIESGELKDGDLCCVVTFGAGLSIGIYFFVYKRVKSMIEIK